MSALADQIGVEITTRHARRAQLDVEIEKINNELEHLDHMAQLAERLNGNAAAAAAKTSKPSAKSRRPVGSSPGRNGGNAPGGRRPVEDRKPGSAPSGTPAPARRASSTSNGDGGAKRAAVLAFVAANGRVKIADVAKAVGLSTGATAAHLKTLRAAGQVGADGATATRVYYASVAGKATLGEAPPSPAPEPPTNWAYVARLILVAIARGPLTVAAIAEKIHAPADVVQQQCDRLVREGKASTMGEGLYVA